ncbi:MAG: tetratricopeptide repeat protein [Ignavibacteriaceae bacterium]|nr:tetratricopeptide repeat protein [Ignavibacteriaceae bacterium]
MSVAGLGRGGVACLAAGVVAATLLQIGCSEQGHGDLYRAERAYWEASRMEAALRMQRATPPTQEETRRVLDAFQRVVDAKGDEAGRDTAMAHAIGRIKAHAERGKVRVHQMRGEDAEVIRVLDGARKRYPWDLDLTLRLHADLAAVLRARGDLDACVRLYQEMASTLPARRPDGRPVGAVQDAPLLAADLLREMGRQEEAAAELDRAEVYYRTIVQENPDDAASALAWVQLGSVEGHRGKYAKAAEHLERARRTRGVGDMEPRVLLVLGTLQQEGERNPAAAARTFAEMAERFPTDPLASAARIRQADCLGVLGRTDEALSALSSVKAAFPADAERCAEAEALGAAILSRAGRWPEALARYRSLMTDYRTSPFAIRAPLEIASHYRQIGEESTARATLQRALEDYEQLRRERPGAGVLRLVEESAARALILLEEWKAAAERLLSLPATFPRDPRNPAALTEAARIYAERLGDRERAAQILEELAATYPSSPLAEAARREVERLRRP